MKSIHNNLLTAFCFCSLIFLGGCVKPIAESSQNLPERPAPDVISDEKTEINLESINTEAQSKTFQVVSPGDVTINSTTVLTKVDLGVPIVTNATGLISYSNNAPVDGFTFGATLVTWAVADESGYSETVYQTVIIVPDQAPATDVESNVNVSVSNPNSTNETTPTSQNTSSGVTENPNTENNSPETTETNSTPLPDLTITLNEVTVEATGPLTVLSLENPLLENGVGNLIYENDLLEAGYPIGTFEINWTVTDDANMRKISGKQIVIIEDTVAPNLIPPANVNAESDSSSELTNVNIGSANATDLVDKLLVISHDAPAAGFPAGETKVTWSVTDSSGNTSTAEQTIFVSVACNSLSPIFQSTVWPVLESKCKFCHNANGSNTPFNLVDANELNSNYHQINFDTFKSIASKTDSNGNSLLSIKPINANGDHGGGNVLQSDSAEFASINQLVTSLQSCHEVSIEQNSILRLTPSQRLRKITLSLAGRLPSDDENTNLAAAIGAPAQEAVISDVISTVMTEPGFIAKLDEVYNDLLLTNYYADGARGLGLKLNEYANKDYFKADTLTAQGYTKDESNTLRHFAGLGIALAPIELIKYVITNNRPYSEILTANYVMVNPYSATVFGASVEGQPDFAFTYGDAIDAKDPNNFQIARLVDKDNRAIPHSGLLTTLAFLSRYPSSNTNINRHRAKIVFKYFLNTDVEGLADRATLDLDNVIGTFPTLEDPQCTICHNVIDPVAGLFKNWDNAGSFRGDYSNWLNTKNPPEMLSPGFTMNATDHLPAEQSGTAMQWLANRIVSDSRFALATAHAIFAALTGQQNNQDVAFFESLKNQFVDSNFDLKVLITSIVNSDYFIADNAGLGVSIESVTNLGTGKLLTPEQLHRKIIATTNGYEWKSPSNRTLLDTNTYNLLYGGIDSINVVTRTTDPNGLMAAVQARIAKQSACEVTPMDFSKPASQRVLFPFVEIIDLPETPDGSNKIKQNIQHLYQQMLAEPVALDSAEITAAYSLFVAVRGQVSDGAIDQECRAGLDQQDPIILDANNTVKSWMAIMNYLFLDYRFLYE